MESWQTAILVAYCIIVALLSMYGYHRYLLLRLFYKHKDQPNQPSAHFTELPTVTIQLPIYNEFHVVDRLLEAVSGIEYPRDRLHIQVLDDSQDDTRDKARRAVERLAATGLDIEYLHRPNREGFKAGALDAGLKRAKGDFIIIFDADFVPPAQILLDSIHYFTDGQVGMVQMRWGHINRDYSLLTHLQSIFLDGHFMVEHTARNRSGRFFNFNGTAGIWRRQAIDDAGGWQHDTLTEDLDLSYRSQLAGWKFHYLPDIEVPAEIPVEINGFKSQQHRWTKGAVQTAKKILPRIWRSDQPLKIKVEATFHLTANISYILMLAMALLTLPVLHLRSFLGWEGMLIIDLPLFAMATMAISGFYLASQRALYEDWKAQIKYLPLLMALGMALCLNNTRAAIEGWIGHQSSFLRTPKYGVVIQEDGLKKRKYASRKTLLALGELLMAAYFGLVLYQAWVTELYFGLPFLFLFHSGFLYIGLMSAFQPFFDQLRTRDEPMLESALHRG